MPSLKYYLRDPGAGVIRQYGAEEIQQLLADDSKPVFFSCLGMDGFSGKTDPERQIRCIEGFFEGHTPGDFHVVAIISGEKQFTDNRLKNYLHHFNCHNADNGKKDDSAYDSEHEQPATFGMQLLKDIFERNIPYVGYVNEEDHKRLLAQAKLKFSQYNFFGHSFGTVVLAETFGYLHDMLQRKGFSEDEANDCLRCMGRLNVGNSYHVTERYAAVPGIDYNSALDRIAQQHDNIPRKRDSGVLLMDRIYNSLLLSPLIGENAVPTVRIKATPDADEEERRTFTSKLSRRPHSPWEMEVGDISDNKHHALQLYMYKQRTQLDPDNARARLTGQAYPGAEITNDFMVRLLDSSAQAIVNSAPRDTKILVDDLQNRLSPPEVRDNLATALKASQERFARAFGTEEPGR